MGILPAALLFGFHSLQTGKSFRTDQDSQPKIPAPGFHSLQTGKSFRTKTQVHQPQITKNVSIPFKRESPFGRRITKRLNFSSIGFPFPSNGKVLSDVVVDVADVEKVTFPFPSNGKVLSDEICRRPNVQLGRVSIPFKRESISKVELSYHYFLMRL